MTIMASADIRLKYNEVVEKCRESGEPIYLTKNGQGELVVMDIESFEKREQELQAQQLVLESFAARLAGEKDYSLEESKKLINNMIEGVEKQFSRTLEVNGVGYRAQLKGKKLVMNLGYSHPVEMDAPEGITFEVPNPNTIIVKGIDKEVVGQTAAVVRTKRPPEVYRGKGIKYAEEHIRRKEGKAGKK